MSFVRNSAVLTTAVTGDAISMSEMKLGVVGMGVIITGDAVATVQLTFNGVDWFDHPVLAALAANTVDSLLYPVAEIRLKVDSVTSGSAKLTMMAT